MNKPIHPIALIGWLLVIGGCAGVLYFVFAFDASVNVPENNFGVERVNNIGLLNDRQTGIIVSSLCVIVGVILLVARWIVGAKEILQPKIQSEADTAKINAELEKRRPVSQKELEWTLKKIRERQK